MKLKCLIVDDEPVARKGLVEYVSEVDFLDLVGQCENALKANMLLNESPVDLIFLDIQMPKLTGIEFLKTLKNPPLIIFTTAYAEYAIEGYSLDIVDYLLKPISFDRFLKSVQKALEIHSLKHQIPQPKSTDYFFVKSDSKFEKVRYDDVTYIEALQNYVIIHTTGKKLITYLTMTGLEAQLPKDQFLKVHKSFIVSVPQIKAIDGSELLIGEARIPISRNLKDDVVTQIIGNKLFKR
jgi:DNA-binding LytR/AlgR family response regulator